MTTEKRMKTWDKTGKQNFYLQPSALPKGIYIFIHKQLKFGL